MTDHRTRHSEVFCPTHIVKRQSSYPRPRGNVDHAATQPYGFARCIGPYTRDCIADGKDGCCRNLQLGTVCVVPFACASRLELTHSTGKSAEHPHLGNRLQTARITQVQGLDEPPCNFRRTGATTTRSVSATLTSGRDSLHTLAANAGRASPNASRLLATQAGADLTA